MEGQPRGCVTELVLILLARAGIHFRSELKITVTAQPVNKAEKPVSSTVVDIVTNNLSGREKREQRKATYAQRQESVGVAPKERKRKCRARGRPEISSGVLKPGIEVVITDESPGVQENNTSHQKRSVLSYRKAARLLLEAGFVRKRQGKHDIFVNPADGTVIPLPRRPQRSTVSNGINNQVWGAVDKH